MDYVYQPSKDRVCAFSYVNEKDLPAGEKLLRCSKCSETFYRDKASQVSHWPLHKRFCCSIEKDSRLLKEALSDVEDAMDFLPHCSFMLREPRTNIRKGQSRVIVHLIQQLRKFLEKNPRYFVSTEDDVGEAIVACVLNPLRKIMDDKEFGGLEALYAIPGFANFFLSEELFLSRVMLERKRNGTPALTQEEESLIEYFTSEEAVLDVEIKFRGFVLPPTYTGLLTQFLMESCLEVDRAKEICRTRTDSLGVAVTRLIFRSWACPYVRASYASLSFEDKDGVFGYDVESEWGVPWPWPSRSGFVSELLESFFNAEMPTQQGEIVPGLSAKCLLTAMIEDSSFFLYGNTDAISKFFHRTNFSECQDPDNGLLKDLTIEDRLEVLRVAGRILCSGKYETHWTMALIEQYKYVLLGIGSEKVCFRLHGALTSSKSFQEPIDDHFVNFVKAERRAILKGIEPNVKLLVHWLEKKFREERLESGIQDGPLFLPDEMIMKICEYATPKQPPPTCSCGMHVEM